MNDKKSKPRKKTPNKSSGSNNRDSCDRKAKEKPRPLEKDDPSSEDLIQEPKDIKKTLWAIIFAQGQAVPNAEISWFYFNKERLNLEKWQMDALLLLMKDRGLLMKDCGDEFPNKNHVAGQDQDMIAFCKRLRETLPQTIKLETEAYWEAVEKAYIKATSGLGCGWQLLLIKTLFGIRITFGFTHCLRLWLGDKLIRLIVSSAKNWIRRLF